MQVASAYEDFSLRGVGDRGGVLSNERGKGKFGEKSRTLYREKAIRLSIRLTRWLLLELACKFLDHGYILKLSPTGSSDDHLQKVKAERKDLLQIAFCQTESVSNM